MIEMCPRAALPAANRHVPRKICQHPKFAEFVNDISDAGALLRVPPLVAWAAYKRILRAAADGVRRILLSAPYSGDVPELITLTSIDRFAACSDARLAAALCVSSPAARHHLEAEPRRRRSDAPRRVRGPHADGQGQLLRRAEVLLGVWKRSAAHGRLAAANRLSTLWSPVTRRLSIHSIRIFDTGGNQTRGSRAVVKSLAPSANCGPRRLSRPTSPAPSATPSCASGAGASMFSAPPRPESTCTCG